jgi:mono/diheme cytochrome c family protein
MSLKRIVVFAQALAIGASAVFVVMLFAGGSGGGGSAAGSPGAQIYSASCARCHGAEGGGGLGPELAGVVVESFPDVEDQIALVSGGIGTMPGFANQLSEEEIRQVVEYTRTELGQ